MYDIIVISDSLGETAEQTAKAALSQFENLEYKIQKFSHVLSLDKLESIINSVEDFNNTIFFYSLADELLLTSIKKLLDLKKTQYIDVMTPSIIAIERLTGISPTIKPGALRKLDENYFKRVEAIEFAVRFDDGKDARGILRSDVVIVGVSRTSKTPLSMYLANKNYRVCNIPLVPETTPPKELFEIPSSKVIGLTNSPENLNKIRVERLKSLGIPEGSSYSDLNRILEEIDYAMAIMQKIGCPIIDVSNKAIEETADIIINYLKKHQNNFI